MIDWLISIIGTVPEQYEYLVITSACVLVIILVVNVINLFFSPFRTFK